MTKLINISNENYQLTNEPRKCQNISSYARQDMSYE